MTAAERKPTKPRGLEGRGLRFWRWALEHYDLDRPALEVLGEACRGLSVLDELDQTVRTDGATVTGPRGGVQAHPALVEARLQRAAVAKLLGQLGLEDVEGEVTVKTATTVRAETAAAARWAAREGDDEAGEGPSDLDAYRERVRAMGAGA